MPNSLGYADDLEPKRAWEILSQDQSATLIDVRTKAEWSYVGVVDTQTLSKPHLPIQWLFFPDMRVNQEFVQTVIGNGLKKDDPLLFLCRSGARSKAAAIVMAEQGFEKCYNILGGFDGDLDFDGHRGKVSGWRADGLPWVQT